MASTPDNLYVTYVDVDRDLLKIWGQRNRIGATYIERQLLLLNPEFNRTPCPNPSQIHKGMFCFAKYTDDNYYRARVLSFQNDSVGVVFVDYGNRDIINMSDIRVQEGTDADVLAKMCEQAEEFYLARIAAPSIGWTKEIISEIRRDICCEEFLYHVVTQVGDKKILEIQFHNDDFSNYLVKKQLAIPLSLPVQSQMILTYCSLVPTEPKLENSSREMSRLTYSPSVPPPPSMRSSFRPLSSHDELMMGMNCGKPPTAMNFSQPPPFHSPRQVTSSFQQMNKSIPRNPYFPSGNLPQNQISGNSPRGVNPVGINQYPPMHMLKESTDAFQGNNFIQMLAQQVKQYIAEDNAKSESEEEKIPHHYVNSVLEVGNTHNVIVSFIDDGPWSFSVQPLSSETELQKLMDELSTVELVHLKPPIVLGHPCIASSALYGNLCRGVVVSICRSAVKVYFVDFGNTEDLPFSSIYELPAKFFKIRVLSQKFSLSGLQKVVYSEDIKKFFKDVVQDELLMLRVMSLEGDNLPTCELYLKDKNIKRILNEKIRELRSTLDDFPKVGETEDVVVTWVVSPQKFFVQLYKRDADLYALKNELAEVSGKGQRLTYQQLSVGFKCLCLYEADGQWYRAVITSVDSENAISVFYVDYGNTETVNISMLRRVETGGLIHQMRNQAIQCSLKGFENKSSDQELTRKLESLTLEKQLQMTVVSSEKELLCVQLFDNGQDISSMMSAGRTAQELTSPFSGESSFTGSSDKTPEEKEPYDRNENKNFRNERLNSEENWREKPKDNYWNGGGAEEQNKIRGFKQTRESKGWEDSNNNSISNTGGFNSNSKSFGQKQDRGRDDWGQGFKQEKNRGAWDEKKESFVGEKKRFDEYRGGREKFNGNRGGRQTFDDNRGGRQRFEENHRGGGGGDRVNGTRGGREKFDGNRGGREWNRGAGDGKRFERGRDSSRAEDRGKRFVRDESSFLEREKKGEERRSTRKPIRKEDIAPPGSKFEEKTLQIGSCERGFVTYYFSPHEFFVQLLSDENEFKKMMEDIQTYYSDKYSIRDPVQAGDIVIAQFSLDKVLYRAEVVKPSPVTVRYVDYGNHEPVGPKTTYFVDKQFLKLPKQVIRCRLSKIEPVDSDWPPPGSAADKFFEMSEYKCTILSWEDDLYEISMEDVGTGKDVAQELIAAGLARPMIPKLDVPEIDLSLLPNQVLRLYVSHVESSSKFYVLLNPQGLEVIKNELKTLSQDEKVIENLVPLAEDLLRSGTPCLSTSNDVLWHRGRIFRNDWDKIIVWCYDSGDCIEVNPNKVMSLPDHLKDFQPQAVECTLYGSSLTISEEEFKKEVEFKHHLVFIAFAAKESLSVILYKEDGKIFDFHDCFDFPQAVEQIPQSPIFSQKLHIVTSHCDSFDEIYIQKISDSDDINDLSDQLESFYSEGKNDLDVEKEGMLVAAKSVVYDSWYRGQLMSSSAEGLEIFYIDYGNKEILPKENVKRLDSSFLSWRAFSRKVAMDVNVDADKTEELIEKFLNLQSGKDVFAYFVNSDGKLFCELVIDGERLAQKFNSPGSSVKDDKFVKVFSGEKTEPEAISQPSESGIAEYEDLKVVVSHVDSPNQFWVHREDQTGDLHLFQDKLQKSCEALLEKKNPAVGDVVTALYLDLWYRARVTKVDGDKLTVQFIDYGNKLEVDLSSNSVRELTEEFLRVPVFATPYSLTGTWSEISTSAFEEIILQNEEALKVVILEKSQPAVVDLYQNGESIAEMLKKRVTEDAEKAEDLCSVYITHANSPSDFYIQRETCEETIKMLNDKLADALDFQSPTSIEKSEIYAAEFPDDGAWYRARVTKVDGKNIEVFFIDYGNTSTVTEIKCLPSDLVDIPVLGENCYLVYGDRCDTWSEAACGKFTEYTDGRKLRMKVVANGFKKQIVKLFDGEKNLTEELETLCEPDGRTEVYIPYAVSPTEFYVQDVEDEYYGKISEKLENWDEAEILEDGKPGDLCQARFVDDGCWYRARIVKKLEDGWDVLFIDFGNVSVATELKKLPSEISEIPPRAFRCSLDIPETNIPESVKEEFINLTAGGAAVFQALILSTGEVKKVSLKLDGRKIEETLNFGEFSLSEGLTSGDGETDDGLNSKQNLISQDYLEDDWRSVCNETDEEKRVKIGGLDGSEGFKSDDEKSTVSSGFVNATDNELMDEARETEREERVNVSEGSTMEEVETPETSVEEIKQEVGGGKENGVSEGGNEAPVNGEMIKEGTKRCHKQSYSEKLVPGSISNGFPLEVGEESEIPGKEEEGGQLAKTGQD